LFCNNVIHPCALCLCLQNYGWWVFKECPILTKTPKQALNHIMVRWNIGSLLTQKALEGVGLIGWCGDNDNYCMPLHAHIGNEKKGFHKKQSYGDHYYMKCGKGNLYSTHPCVPTNLWKWWSLGRIEPTLSQCYLRSEIPIHRNILLHMWMGIAREHV